MPEERTTEYVSNKNLQLELKAMRSEFRLWLIAAVVANSTLSHVVLPPAVGFIGGVGLALVIVVKTVLFR